ncbi:histidine phosphatase superfamily [Lipomyces oligophaga]|uniref:histidine phosphatase superfamily n=1 Tax=Lipomyces oligophaga TaxID=45792 RepID=UPI0034CD2F62
MAGSGVSKAESSISEAVLSADAGNVQLQVFFIRHGQTDANLNHILQGQMDTTLNAEGERQAQKCNQVTLHEISFDLIYSSDLRRCIRTRDLAFANHIEVVRTDPIKLGRLLRTTQDFRERDCGEYQGREVSEVSREIQRKGLSWQDLLEPQDQFDARLDRGWTTFLAELVDLEMSTSTPPSKCKRAAIISHGGAISTLVAALVNKYKYTVSDAIPVSKIKGFSNTSITVVNISLNRYGKPCPGSIVVFNNVDHLSDFTAVENADQIIVDKAGRV